MHNKHILGRVQVTRECNQDCVFCSAPPADKEISLEKIKKKIIELKKHGTTDLMITGGEPTKRKDLFKILHFCVQQKFPEITIQTNGSNLDNYGFMRRLSRIPGIKFNISFHSSDPEIFGKISNNKENYKKLLQGLKYVGKFKIPAYFTIVINKLNYKKLKEHVMFIKKNIPHITHLSFNYIDPIYMAKKNDWTVPTYAESERYIHDTVDFMRNNGMTFRVERLPLCYMAGFEEFSSDIRRGIFDEDRMISFLKAKGDLEDQEFIKEKYSRFFYAPQCKICSLNTLCPGINPNYVNIHGYHEVFPVFEDPMKIIERVKGSKLTLDDRFRKKVLDDLNLFKHAISIKPNKNNVYDTYSYFLTTDGGIKDEDFIYKSWKELLKKIKEKKVKDLLSFYIHIPYCESNCLYCCYPSTTLKKEEQLQDYLDFLIRKMKRFSPLFKDFKFKTLYIGGGTPSIFSEKQFKNLLDELFTYFKFEKYSEKAIELNPRSTTFKKLKVLDNYGFNKISIGVQSLSKKVLKVNNRGYQTKEMVKKVIDDFNKLDLNYINADLLLGLKNDTVKDFTKSFEELCQLGPINICIYPVKTNDNYIKKNYDEDFNKFKRFYYPLFDEVAKKLPIIAEKYGYSCHYEIDKLSYIAPLVFSKHSKKRKEKIDYSYTHFNLPPYSNFCLGYYSHSRIVDMMDYQFIDKNKKDSMFLKKFSSDPRDYMYTTQTLLPLFERVKFIIKKFYKDWEVPRKQYQEFYNTDIVDDFPYAIKALKLFDIIRVRHDKIIFNKIDEKELYPFLLFFVGRENVLRKINNH